MNINMNNGRVVIDGKEFSGSNISIKNGKVTVDGVKQDGDLVGDIDIKVYGDCKSIENSSGTVTVNSAGHIKTASGDVRCGNVSGSVQTMSGDVTCSNVGGGVKTMSGDVSHN